ncbi:hypothetical protein COY91_02670 [Candidatus Shapirobacteria bacterium CG_4_10_14_0_8_um_filter_39_15]|nr:MAG: hypothetical protein COY91_02670 [Candidatus Shapirobacteria bacterium CG_4_10_14_0_8_um_filter_39_15]PJE68370.1 MAG: hypothetical protein COU94_02195 [Candidatus Shapirobacteria bacterium CG10_big_fil_rev_8_21_14_0_10_38_8]
MNQDNNFQTVFWPVKGVETVLVSLWVRSGGWYETKVKRGIFHFLEHVLAQGTKRYSSYLELSKKLEELGINPKNSVGGYFSIYNWIIPKETFSDSLALLAEYVFNPLLPKEAIERERKIILLEYFDYWDKPINHFNHSLGESFFGKGHPYTFDALGTKESIENITKDDLVEAHKQYYQLNNMILGVVGDLEEKFVNQEINKNFKNQRKGEKIVLTDDVVLDFTRKIVFSKKNADQVDFSLNFPTIGFKEEALKEKYSLAMLSYLLGRSRVSRLNLRIREKEPLSYSIGSSVKHFPQKGVFTVGFLSSIGNSRRAIEIIKEEIETIKRNGISEEEFRGCQKSFIYHVSLSFDTIYSIADNLMDNLGCKGRIFLPEEKKRAIAEVTKEDLSEMAKRVFDFDKATIGFMGNKENLEEIKSTGIDRII